MKKEEYFWWVVLLMSGVIFAFGLNQLFNWVWDLIEKAFK